MALLQDKKQSDELLSNFTLLMLTIPWFGVQFSWSAEFATQTPFLDHLGLSNTVSTMTWAAGAVTGFLVQPIVGSFSDSCRSKMGRRRPFIIGGTVCTIVAQLLFAWAETLGSLLGDTKPVAGHGGSQPFAIAFAVSAVWLLGASINVIQTPIRAIVADLAPPSQQEKGQSFASMWQAFGAITGFLIVFFFKPLEIMRSFFGVSSLLLFSSSLLCIFYAHEVPLSQLVEEATGGVCKTIKNRFAETFEAIGRVPKPLIRIYVAEFFTWAAWFTLMPNWSAWLGEYLYGGDPRAAEGSPTRKLYEDGMSLGGIGQAAASAVQFLFSMLLASEFFMKKFKLRMLYVFTFLLLIGTLFGMGMLVPVSKDTSMKVWVIVLMALTGIPLAATNVFPFSITGKMYKGDENLALYMGCINIFIVAPQFVDTLYCGKVADSWGWDKVLLIGGVWATLATISLFFLQVTKPEGGLYERLAPGDDGEMPDTIDDFEGMPTKTVSMRGSAFEAEP